MEVVRLCTWVSVKKLQYIVFLHPKNMIAKGMTTVIDPTKSNFHSHLLPYRSGDTWLVFMLFFGFSGKNSPDQPAQPDRGSWNRSLRKKLRIVRIIYWTGKSERSVSGSGTGSDTCTRWSTTSGQFVNIAAKTKFSTWFCTPEVQFEHPLSVHQHALVFIAITKNHLLKQKKRTWNNERSTVK